MVTMKVIYRFVMIFLNYNWILFNLYVAIYNYSQPRLKWPGHQQLN